ncbi:MAG: hypothetical protein HYU39_02260 [Thaumarchaeota archaeon]|nr:hypothetical protein [Nitrososphaerota archaeon]
MDDGGNPTLIRNRVEPWADLTDRDARRLTFAIRSLLGRYPLETRTKTLYRDDFDLAGRPLQG